VILANQRERNQNIWHMGMELWQTKLSIDSARMALDPATNKPWFSEEQFSRSIVVIDDYDGPWDAAYEILTGTKPVKYQEFVATDECYDIVIPTRGWGSPFWVALLSDGHFTPCHGSNLMTAFVDSILRWLGLKERSPRDIHEHPNITIIQRDTTRKIYDLDTKVAKLSEKFPKSIINVENFSKISMKEQIRIIQETDILIGHHGAGMMHTIFLPRTAAAIEWLPPTFFNKAFRRVARMRGVTHFSPH
ncbi:hypothetical protein GQ53DRAFT_592915, partial [Thozetella sp. PMI_491]